MQTITITVVNPSGANIVINEIRSKSQITDKKLKQMLRELGRKQREVLCIE